MDTQKRAAAGGEVGPNGEWYPGGAFIATTDAPKSAPYVPSPDAVVWQAENQRKAADIAAWLESRRVVLAAIIAALTANPGHDVERWAWMLENGHAGFLPSLGRQLFMGGALSRNQAQYAVKAILGRQTKRNADEWDAMLTLLTDEYK